jgi:type IV secretion system protein VirB4
MDSFSISAVLRELESALTRLDERFYLWWVVDKRRSYDYPSAEFPSDVAREIDQHEAERYQRGEVFSIVFRIFLVYTGETGVYAFLDHVRKLVNENHMSLPKAALVAMNPTAVGRGAALHDARQLDDNMEQANNGMRHFAANADRMSFRLLEGWELDAALFECANPTVELGNAPRPHTTALLDSALANTDVVFGREVVEIAGPNRTMYGSCLALKEYPLGSGLGLMQRIFTMPVEFRLAHVIHCMSQVKARATLNEISRYYKMTQSSMLQQVVAYLSGREPEVDPGKADLYMQCLEAERRLEVDNLGWVQHAMTVMLLEPTVKQLERTTNEVVRSLSKVPLIRERIGLKSAYKSMLPGQWSEQKRMLLANVEIVSDSVPFISIDPGPDNCKHLTETVYHRPMPPLARFHTVLNTSTSFDPYVGQVGHALVVMPTGSGKTTFVNYCLSQFTRYPDAQVVIFDRDKSCRILTGLVDGTHIDLKSERVQLNPLQALHDGKQGMLWVREWVLNRLADGNFVTTPEHRNEIDELLRQMVATGQTLSLSTLHALLSRDLSAALQEWVGEGPLGMFDSPKDDLNLANWTCIEMKEIMAVDRLSRAFLDHAFRVLTKRLKPGRPTFIYLEEASFLLNSPNFLPALDDWLKTFRKLDAYVWLTLQSPESIAAIENEAIRATLADNIPNLILGYNQRIENHRDLYKKMFAMTDEQVDVLAKMRPKRDYLHIANGICRVLGTKFDDYMLARLRSEASYQALFDEAKMVGGSDWKSWYLDQALRRSRQ